MDHSPLKKLPAELRNHVYEYALIDLKDVVLRHNGTGFYCWSVSATLLGTCRQIHNEIRNLLCAVNDDIMLDARGYAAMYLTCGPAVHRRECSQLCYTFRKWLATVGGATMLAGKSVTINLGRSIWEDNGDFVAVWKQVQNHLITPACTTLTSYKAKYVRVAFDISSSTMLGTWLKYDFTISLGEEIGRCQLSKSLLIATAERCQRGIEDRGRTTMWHGRVLYSWEDMLKASASTGTV